MRRLARWAGGVDAVIAGSEHLLAAHAGIFAATPSTVIRLPLAASGASPTEPPSALRDLGYLGALTAAKGVDMLLAAAPELARSGVRVRIAGDGPLRARVEEAPVDYAGRLDGPAVAEFTHACDAGIVPSTWEEPGGPPYTVCDWLAAGRPVLAARRGGLTEIQGSGGVAGFEPTRAGIVDAVSGLRDPDRWERIVGAVPEVADGRDLERWLDEHEAVYASAIARRP
jgi:glycosyltransferase involved in cell wall biosynthesis